MTTLANTVNTLAQTESSSSNGSNNSSNSTPPSNKTSPTTSLPTRLPEITSPKEVKNTPSFKDQIVTADLEAIITPGGYIGLLPFKQGGRLICPGGIFTGVFFSDFCHRNYIY